MSNRKGASPAPDRCERLSLTTPTKRRLWAESGGYCQRPECAEFLFPDGSDVDFAEMAHIVAATTGGARDLPKREMTEPERAHHSNVAILCANCHTTVDKDPDQYPVALMREWKERHQRALEQVFGTPTFDDRAAAREYLEPMMAENRRVFLSYGPVDHDLSEERAERWRSHAVSTIVPNNAKIARTLTQNRRILTSAEKGIADLFLLHQREFEARHVLDDFSAGTSTYPAGMDDILETS